MVGETDWSKLPLTEDGQFACWYCKGTKVLSLGKMHGKCWCCGGSGYQIDVVMESYTFEKSAHESTRQELKKLKDWVAKTSKCTVCQGNSYNTLGGIDCPECGLAGSQPWGG